MARGDTCFLQGACCGLVWGCCQLPFLFCPAPHEGNDLWRGFSSEGPCQLVVLWLFVLTVCWNSVPNLTQASKNFGHICSKRMFFLVWPVRIWNKEFASVLWTTGVFFQKEAVWKFTNVMVSHARRNTEWPFVDSVTLFACPTLFCQDWRVFFRKRFWKVRLRWIWLNMALVHPTVQKTHDQHAYVSSVPHENIGILYPVNSRHGNVGFKIGLFWGFSAPVPGCCLYMSAHPYWKNPFFFIGFMMHLIVGIEEKAFQWLSAFFISWSKTLEQFTCWKNVHAVTFRRSVLYCEQDNWLLAFQHFIFLLGRSMSTRSPHVIVGSQHSGFIIGKLQLSSRVDMFLFEIRVHEPIMLPLHCGHPINWSALNTDGTHCHIHGRTQTSPILNFE
jgi:hypothetical protein